MGTPFAIGIDLGTSTSEICVFRNNEPHPIFDSSTGPRLSIVPSIVATKPNGEIAVGSDALPYIERPGAGVWEAKRKMGTGKMETMQGRQYRPEEIGALILRKLKQNAEEFLGEQIGEVVLSVPANFPDAARQATLNAGQLAGLKVLQLINEPTAAALAFGINNIDVEEQIVVFDFGGGTLDITVLEMMGGILDVKCSFGDDKLGGKDIDQILMRVIYEKFQADHPDAHVSDSWVRYLKTQAERAKIALSAQHSTSVSLPNFGIRSGEPVDLEVEVTRREFEEATASIWERARTCLRQALNAKNVRPSAVDRVLLVGGTTYIPKVRQLVAEMFGREPKADVNADLAVAIGASIRAALSAGLISQSNGIILTDVMPFSLGIDVMAMIGGRPTLVYDPLIQANTTIPYSIHRDYTLLHEHQKEVEVRLYQDNTGKARFPSEAVDTGLHATIPDIPPASDGRPHPLEVDFSYDINACAKLVARIPTTGQRIELKFEGSAKRMDAEQLIESQQRVDELWRKNPRAKRYEAIIEKAKRLTESVDLPNQRKLRAAIAALQDALSSNDEDGANTAGDQLTDLLFDLENDASN